MGTGLQQIPFRIPEKWDQKWFQQFIRDVLQLLDARNSIGVGLTVTGDPDTLATYSVDEDILNLVDQTFVLVSPSTFLPNERIITGSTSITLTDAGPGGTLTIDLADHSIPYDKLAELTSFGVIGRAPHIPGGPEEILASIDGDVLCVQSDALGFTNAPIWTGIHNWIDGIATTWGTDSDLFILHDGSDGSITNVTGALTVGTTSDLNLNPAGTININGVTITEFIQDVAGSFATDSTTIDFTYDDTANTLTAAVIQSFAYVWTADHTWSSTNPHLYLTRTSAGTNEKSWGISANGATSFALSAFSDNLLSNRVILQATKIAGDFNLDNIQIGNSNVAHTYTFPSSGTATWHGTSTFINSGGTQVLTGTTVINSNPGSSGLEHLVDIVNNDSAYAMLRLSTYGDAPASQNTFHFMRARGSLASPTAVQTGDILMSIGLRGNDGTSTTGSVTAVIATAKENWSGSQASTDLDFQLSALAGGSRASVLYLTGSDVTTKTVHKFTKIGAAATPSVAIESTLPILELHDTDASADEGTVQIFQAGNLFIMRKNDDADTTNRRFIEVQGSGAAVAAMIYGNSTDNPTHTFNGQVIETTNIMARTSTAYTNGAAASLGTLTNAPAAGNPTKWIPVNDNGTTRYIPAW